MAWADARHKRPDAVSDGTDDVAFITWLVEKLVADGAADVGRVSVTDIFNGAP